MSARLTAIAIAVLVTAAPGMARTPQRPIGDVQVFATLPYPGHPGGLAVDGRTLYVDTSNGGSDRPFDDGDEGWGYNLDTAQPTRAGNPITAVRHATGQPLGLMGMALGAPGRLLGCQRRRPHARPDRPGPVLRRRHPGGTGRRLPASPRPPRLRRPHRVPPLLRLRR